MILSAFTVLYKDRPLSEVLDILKSKGISHAEIGTGGFHGGFYYNKVAFDIN
jgi:hypothetical protein